MLSTRRSTSQASPSALTFQGKSRRGLLTPSFDTGVRSATALLRPASRSGASMFSVTYRKSPVKRHLALPNTVWTRGPVPPRGAQTAWDWAIAAHPFDFGPQNQSGPCLLPHAKKLPHGITGGHP